MIQKSYPFNRPITFPYVAPGNPRETLSPQENEMFGLKRGGKAKRGKKNKQQGITQIQKVNIKIGDLSKLLERKKNDDTATIMKSKTPSLVFPSNDSTYIRLEAPAYRYAQPLPSVIPNLYQANPSSISNPILSSIPSSSRGGNLQPAVNNPILQDTDPNDLQQNSSRAHSIRAIPSPYYISGYSTPASQQEEYIASRLLNPRHPGDGFMSRRWIDAPRLERQEREVPLTPRTAMRRGIERLDALQAK